MGCARSKRQCLTVPQNRRCRTRKFILREVPKLGSNHTVKFSMGTWHHTKIRERKGPSRGVTQKCEPQQRSPCSPKFEDRTQEETAQQERCARREARDLAKHVRKLKNTDKATFYSPTDPRASMHMLSKQDLSSGELDTLRKSRNSTMVVTDNGEVQQVKKHMYTPTIWISS